MNAREKSLKWQQDQRRYNFLRIWNKRYYHMKARHEGCATHFSHSQGKGLITQEEFLMWCMEQQNFSFFIAMYHDWAMNGFNLWESPSIDRIDPNKGYVLGNLQWLTFGENTEKNHKDPITHKQMKEYVDA